MLEIAQHFEQVSLQFNHAAMIGLGVALVLVGLFIWLGGLGVRKLLVGIVGAVVGGICGFFVAGRNIVFAAAGAVLASFIAIIFEKIFITILAAVLAGFCGLVVLSTFGGQSQVPISFYHIETNQAEHYNFAETVSIIKTYVSNFSSQIKRIYMQMPKANKATIMALIIITIAAGFFLWQLTSAFGYAALGTIFVFAGMILLLLYKGSAPVSAILQKQVFYSCVFIIMITFGTIVQLLFCRPTEKKQPANKEVNNTVQANQAKKANWRTS